MIQFLKNRFRDVSSLIIKLISDSLPAWRQFKTIAPLHPPDCVAYRLPINYNQLANVYRDVFTHSAPSRTQRVFVINNAFSTNNGISFKNLKVFVPSLAEPWVKDQLAHTFLLKQWYGKHIQLPQSEEGIAIVYDQWSNGNYYHWLIDSLPRLLVLRQHFPNYLLLLPAEAAHFVTKTASILGFTRYLFIEPEQILEAHKLVIPEITAPPSFHDPILIRQVRREITAALGENKRPPYRRVYVSRAKQTIRRLTNEHALIQILEKYNFETVYFEDYSFEEQVMIAQEAEIIIGVHGANLTNILFMQPNTIVIELMNELNIYPIYYHICTYLQLNYYLVPCQQAIEKYAISDPNDLFYYNNQDLTVNIRKLDFLFNDIFCTKEMRAK